MRIVPEVHPTAPALATAVAETIVGAAARAAPGPFRIALSGGSTPLALFAQLAGAAGAGVDWARWHVFWGDERCVAPEHPDSNYAAAHAALLARVPIPAGQVHRIRGELGPQAAADAYEAELADALGAPGAQLDLALQGVGGDGHTASLFPHHPALVERGRRAVAVHVPDVAPPRRVSLTLPCLAGARTVLFVASGAAKAGVLRTILADPGAAAARLPAAQLHLEAAGRARWALDAAAAGG